MSNGFLHASAALPMGPHYCLSFENHERVLRMILTCPSCGTQYVVKDGAIPPSGRQVRCKACQHSWREMPAEAQEGFRRDRTAAEQTAEEFVSETVDERQGDYAPIEQYKQVAEGALPEESARATRTARTSLSRRRPPPPPIPPEADVAELAEAAPSGRSGMG